MAPFNVAISEPFVGHVDFLDLLTNPTSSVFSFVSTNGSLSSASASTVLLVEVQVRKQLLLMAVHFDIMKLLDCWHC